MPYTCRKQTVYFNEEERGVQQDFLAIQKQLLRQRKVFKDDKFPANLSSLYYSKQPEYDFTWKRPGDIVKDPKLIVDDASRFDVKQGILEDCWMLAGMANLAVHPDLRSFIIPTNQSFDEDYAGIFHFRFWRHGSWIDVVVDDLLPMVNGQLAFAKSTTGQEFWSALLEKAYAKMFGSYQAIELGQTIESMVDLSGGVPEIFNLREEDPNKLFNILYKAYCQQAWLTCTIPNIPNTERKNQLKDKYGLVTGHAYTLTAVRRVKFDDKPLKQRLIRIRNPWGNDTEWKGAYSDKSAEWKTISGEELKTLDLEFKNDGEFWMHYSEFLRYFKTVEVCHLSEHLFTAAPDDFSANYKIAIYHNSWNNKDGTAGGNLNHKMTYKANPQYRITLKELDIPCTELDAVQCDETEIVQEPHEGHCTLIVSLMQKNRRKGKQTGMSSLKIGFYVYLIPDPENWPTKKMLNMFFGSHQPLYSSNFKHNYREVFKRLHLQPGTYLIVPCTDDPYLEADFMLRILTEKEVDSHSVQ